MFGGVPPIGLAQAPSEDNPGRLDEDDEQEVKVSRRMADMLETCPGFSGDVPTPEQDSMSPATYRS